MVRKAIRPATVSVLAIAFGAIVTAFAARASYAQEVEFSEEYLNNEENIKLGEKRFLQRCTFCHAKKGPSGKGPQLRPSERMPEFIFDRVTNGYGTMIAWKTILTEEDRKALVAFIRSDPDKY